MYQVELADLVWLKSPTAADSTFFYATKYISALRANICWQNAFYEPKSTKHNTGHTA
jgi:hypothetical protein